ncbi:M1 family metallopeptidase [Bacteroidota bacterium]
MKKKLFSLIMLIFCTGYFTLFSQEYFQQEVNYKIDVKLNDKSHELSAFETIEYINNSPDALEFIYFHLWPNAYDNNSTALAKQKLEGKILKLFDLEEQRGYIDKLDFKVNEEKVKWELDKEHIDICKIILNKALKSGEKIQISTPFHVKIPKGVTSRLGHIEESYQITQWYPKPAVYDKYGWHQMPYLSQGEFYSEFGSFDVSITLPKNYIVGATGDLQNKEEIKWLNELAEKTAKIETFKTDSLSKIFPPSSNEFKTIRYIQKNVHDFAWFADKRFNVLKGEVELPYSKRKVTSWAMFTNDGGKLWKRSIEYINDALYYYSKWNGDYPYKHATAILSALSAGGGMEYPNITVIGQAGNDLALEMVIMHEVGHNWFYGILGFNERDFGWMDEGINSFNEARYMRTKYGKGLGFGDVLGLPKEVMKFIDLGEAEYKYMHEFLYSIVARQNIDQHASLNAGDYTSTNYGLIVYFKSARIIDYLMNYLGEEQFDKIMQNFFNKWKYKHPYPEDLQKSFEGETGKDLGWLFDDLLKTTKKIDYKISRIKNNKVLVRNIGNINSPISITGLKNSKPVYTKWFEGFKGKKWLSLSSSSDIDKVQIDNNYDMLEINRKNNQIRTSGLFKKIEPLRIKPFGIVENPDRTSLNILPAMGWNSANRYMLGAVFYTPILPMSKFEYQIMPLYSFGTKDIAGSFAMKYHILPVDAIIQDLSIGVSGKQYAFNDTPDNNFRRIKAEVDFLFRNNYPRIKKETHLIINGIRTSNPINIQTGNEEEYINIYNVKFIHNNEKLVHPYNFSINIEAGDGFAKGSVDAKYKINYNSKGGLDIRLFAGTFLYKENNSSSLYNFRLSGTKGNEDYTYDEIFFERQDDLNDNNILSHQFISNQGAFATYTPYGQTNEWMLALNLSSSLPVKKNIPLKIFANIASFGDCLPVPGYTGLGSFEWEAGVKFSILQDSFEIFLPLVMSKDLLDISNDMTDNFLGRIRFSIKLNKLNPFDLIKNAF